VSFENKLEVAGHGNRDETVVLHSFDSKMRFLWDRKGISVTRDDRSLPSLPTYKARDSGGGCRRAKFSLAKSLVFGEAREVARQMLDDSVKFLTSYPL
jgi:hypothetical protein